MEIKGITGSNTVIGLNSRKTSASDTSFENHLKNVVNKNDDQQLREVCKEFEGILLNMMYKQMRASVPKSDLIPGDIGRDVFESMLDEKLMEEVSKGNGLGLADVLYNQLSKQVKSTYQPSEAGKSLQIDESK